MLKAALNESKRIQMERAEDASIELWIKVSRRQPYVAVAVAVYAAVYVAVAVASSNNNYSV